MSEIQNRGFELEEDMATVDLDRENHLLVIAIDEYEHVRTLSNCVRDAEAFIEVLVNQYQFDARNITKLYNDKASRSEIVDTLDNLANDLTEDDNLLIYFAGHGYYKRNTRTGFIVPVDGKTSRISTLIFNSQIRDYIFGMAVHHLFLLVDSCFSGELILRSTDDEVNKMEASYAQKANAFPSRWGLAAGLIEKVSDGLVGDHSPFANSLISFLTRYPGDQFAVSELIQHVKKTTTYNASQTPTGGVLKNTKDQGGEFIFRKKGAKALDITASKSQGESRASDEKPNQVQEVDVSPQKAQEEFGQVEIKTEKVPEEDMPIKKQLKNLLIEGHLMEILDRLEDHLPPYDANTIILLKSQLNSLNRDIGNSLISAENAEIRSNRLKHTITQMIDKIP